MKTIHVKIESKVSLALAIFELVQSIMFSYHVLKTHHQKNQVPKSQVLFYYFLKFLADFQACRKKKKLKNLNMHYIHLSHNNLGHNDMINSNYFRQIVLLNYVYNEKYFT